VTRANGAGFVIGSAIKSVPIAGKDLTLFVQQLMRERGEKVRFPPPPPPPLDVPQSYCAGRRPPGWDYQRKISIFGTQACFTAPTPFTALPIIHPATALALLPRPFPVHSQH
jgi:hypothetical protein